VSAERHRRGRELFAAARELDEGAVAGFLDEACDGDEALRAEVEGLLRCSAELDRAAGAPARRASVANYRVVRLIGEGGMGEVWEAEQLAPVARRVALKLVRWGMDSRQVLARFEAERQALALMNHPNIAAVYDAGESDDGRPYFAMEYVEGTSLTAYCDAQRLAIGERLRLFVEVCGGVQHAHQKGVIHRDLKPGNILVALQDGRPVPKIIDFGVAKAVSQRLTERTLFTELGQWIGTPEYMSPEQAQGGGEDVDTRTDVYSLGVLLYELIAGAPPVAGDELRKAGFDEMRRRIREEEPLRPSTRVSRMGPASEEAAAKRRTDAPGLARALRGDLDWIVLKTLEKERARRYGSPAELAADLGRHLANEPVSASPPSALYRAGKFVRRNRVAVTAAALVAAALVAAVAGTAHGLVRARREADTARRVSGLMETMIAELNPQSRQGFAADPQEMLDHGLARIESELAGQPLEQARLMAALGVAYAGLGEPDSARRLLERALEIRRAHLGENDLDSAATVFALGNVLIDLHHDEDALRLHLEALAIRERLLPPGHGLIVLSLERAALVELLNEDCPAALAFSRRALAAGECSGVTAPELESALAASGAIAASCEDLDLARALLERAVVAREGSEAPENLGTARAYFNYAGVLDSLGETERAVLYAERAVGIWEAMDGPRDRRLSMGLLIAATANQHAGRLEVARSLFDQARAIVATFAELPNEWELRLVDMADVLARLGETDAALELLQEALDLGLDDPAFVEAPEFASLRGDPTFAAIAAEVQRRRAAAGPEAPAGA
jgi:non-specific serine/threonine protein kinase/serine/threonine-protein kinase